TYCFLSIIPRYPLQRGTTHRITWPSILTFRPACFRLGRFSKVEDLPTIRSLCTKRQTRLLPAFLKVDSPAHEVPKRPTLFCNRIRASQSLPRGLQPSNAFTDRTFCVRSGKDHHP